LKSTELNKKDLELSVKFNWRLQESKEKSKFRLKPWKRNSEWLKWKNRWTLIGSKENKDLSNTELNKTRSELKESQQSSFTKNNKKKNTIEDKLTLNSPVLSMVKDSSKKDTIEK